ncbi:hypothetical protein ES702_04086 [subsurface metagenome]
MLFRKYQEIEAISRKRGFPFLSPGTNNGSVHSRGCTYGERTHHKKGL